jgi:fructose-1-phosphate kinase PfkB-like protein
MGVPSIAAGLWGRDDHDRMLRALDRPPRLIDSRMTIVEGRTRQNITVVDTSRGREMHLRQRSTLASERSLQALHADLTRLVAEGDLCVFSGALPDGQMLEQTPHLVQTCRQRGASIVVDSHGPALKAIVAAGLAWLISPNVEELEGLLCRAVEDTAERLADAGRGLLDRMEMLLISRGRQGALLVSRDGAWTGRCTTEGRVLSTVGCGDTLLAGFLAGLRETPNPSLALARAIQAATARAWGWAEERPWAQVEKEVPVQVERL